MNEFLLLSFITAELPKVYRKIGTMMIYFYSFFNPANYKMSISKLSKRQGT